MSDLVSILIPAYNSEMWIGDTIKSALSQTWRDIEIIIVDDGSIDDTFLMAEQFQSKNVKVIHQENMGACAARNKALSYCQGDYIQWLDSDDLLHPQKIETQLARVEGCWNSNVLLSAACGQFYFRPKKARFRADACWQNLAPVEWLITKFNQGVGMLPVTWLVSRHLTELSGLWDERLTLDDDGEYSCRLVSKSSNVEFVYDSKCYYRRANLNSLSNNISHESLNSFCTSIFLCIEYLLSLEDSLRTRSACINHFVNNLLYFYPERKDLLEKIYHKSAELGVEKISPCLTPRFLALANIIGFQAAKDVKSAAWKAEVLVRKNWDRFLHLMLDGRSVADDKFT